MRYWGLIIYSSWLCLKVSAQLLPVYGNSRTATSGAVALKLPLDAYSTSLSGGVVAAIGSPAAAHWNPGALPLIDSSRWSLQTDYLRYAAGIEGGAATVVYSRRHLKYWAFRWASIQTDYLNVTDEFHPHGNGNRFAYTVFIPSISYGMVLSNNFNFGITTRLFHERFYTVRNLAFLVDLGFVYDLRFRYITRIGVAASNFGFILRPVVQSGDSLLRGNRLIPPAVFRLGAVREIWRRQHHQLLASIQLNHPTDNNETVVTALEYGYDHRFFVRIGHEWGTDLRRLPTAGAGFRWPWRWGDIRADYAIRSLGTLGWTHAMSVALYIQ